MGLHLPDAAIIFSRLTAELANEANNTSASDVESFLFVVSCVYFLEQCQA